MHKIPGLIPSSGKTNKQKLCLSLLNLWSLVLSFKMVEYLPSNCEALSSNPSTAIIEDKIGKND
jgi:hypothetical protein